MFASALVTSHDRCMQATAACSHPQQNPFAWRHTWSDLKHNMWLTVSTACHTLTALSTFNQELPGRMNLYTTLCSCPHTASELDCVQRRPPSDAKGEAASMSVFAVGQRQWRVVAWARACHFTCHRRLCIPPHTATFVCQCRHRVHYPNEDAVQAHTQIR